MLRQLFVFFTIFSFKSIRGWRSLHIVYATFLSYADTVFRCSPCKIHRYVAASFKYEEKTVFEKQITVHIIQLFNVYFPWMFNEFSGRSSKSRLVNTEKNDSKILEKHKNKQKAKSFLIKNLDNLRLTTEDSKLEQISLDGYQKLFLYLHLKGPSARFI